MRTVFKALPFGAFHPTETARWLEEQAQNGLLLRGTGGYTGVLRFEKGEPRAVRYHAERANRGEPASFERDDGSRVPWVTVGAARGMYIYSCDEPAAPLPSYDRDAELAALRRERTSALLYILAWALLTGLWLYDFFVPSAWVSLTESCAIAKLFLTVAFAVIIVSRIALMIGAAAAVKRWQTDTEADPPRTAGCHITAALICAVCSALSLITLIVPLLSQPTDSFDVPIPTAEDLIEDVDLLQSGSSMMLTREFSLIAPTQFSLRQQGLLQLSNDGLVQIDMAATYYETISPTVARHLVEDLVKTELIGRYEEPVMPDVGIDYAAVYEWSQVAYLQHGNKVLVIDMGATSALSATLETLDWVHTAADRLKT